MKYLFRARKPQPDNREFNESRNGEDEACIAVLNDFYRVNLKVAKIISIKFMIILNDNVKCN